MAHRTRSTTQRPRLLDLGVTLALIGLLAGCASTTATTAPTRVRPSIEVPGASPPPPPAVKVMFVADRIGVRPGECAILRWKVTGGEVVQLDGVLVDAASEKTVCPDRTTTYTLAVYVGVGPPAAPHTEQQVVISVGEEEIEPSTATPAMTAAPVTGVTVHRNRVYSTYQMGGTEHQLLLDLYVPDREVSQRLPTLLFIHGGGWFEGSKDTCPGETLARYGYAVACVDYRLGDFRSGCPPELTFPAQLQDVTAAVRWLRMSADDYGLDPGRFGALGDSSGGHLAALLGTSSGAAGSGPTDNPGASDAVQAVAVWYPPVDVTQSTIVFEDDPCMTDLETLNETYGGEETQYFYWTLAWGTFLGGSLADPEVLQRAVEASPLTYVDAGDPPFLVIQGQADGSIPVGQSDLLVSALTDAGVDVEYVQPPGLGHVFAAPPGSEEEIVPEILDPTVDFFARYLGGNARPASPQATAEPPAATGLTWVRTGGPPGGLGYDIRYNFSDPNTWYVTEAFAGVHISTDNGLTWRESNMGIPGQAGATGDGIPVFCLTVDPNDPQIVWAGTQYAGHIYKSTDGGQTWVQKDQGVTIDYDLLSFRGFTVDPRSSDVVYAMGETNDEALGGPSIWSEGVGGVVYKTTDGGEHWNLLWDGGMPSSLARYLWIDTRGPEDVLYVSTGIFDRGAVGQGDPQTDPLGGLGILKSDDGGQTWRVLNEANGLEMLYVGSLYMHPDDPDILLAAAGHDMAGRAEYMEQLIQQGINPSGVWRTTDGGEYWVKVLDPPVEHAGEAMSSVELCPGDPDVAYAGSNKAIYRSEDAGLTWTLVNGGPVGWGPPGVGAGWPIDMQCDPRDPDRVFANNYGGGNFLSEDGGRTWRNASQGYTGAKIHQVEVSPSDPAQAYAGNWRTDDGGTAWVGLLYPEAAGGAFTVAIDPAQSGHVLLAEGFGDLLETTDAGSSWQKRWGLGEISAELAAGTANQMVSALVYAPSDPTTVYASLCHDYCALLHETPLCQLPGAGVLVSRDGGTSWERAVDENIKDVCVIDLAVAPGDASTVYAAAASGLLKTVDGGGTWTALTGLPEQVPVRAVAVNPANKKQIVAGLEGLGIYVSGDEGQSWLAGVAGLEPNGSLHDIVYDPMDVQVVYASDHSSGVYRSEDGGLTWTKINDGLRTRAAFGLSISSDGQHLYVSTDGEGIFRLDLNGLEP